MDIYSYLNSKDVAEHCRTINHQFNAIGTAFIINACRHISLEEKLHLFQEIIDTMPDEILTEKARILRTNMQLKYEYFHAALAHYTEAMRNSLKGFTTSEPDAVFSWEFSRTDWHDNIDRKKVYSTYAAAKEALMKELLEDKDEDLELYTGYIRKLRLDSEDSAFVTMRNGILTDLYDSRIEDECEFFESIWVKIPVPFKEGDLLWGTNPHQLGCSNTGKEPMVFVDVCYEGLDENDPKDRRRMAGRDASDMTAYGYWLDEKGRLYTEVMHSYHDLEYYRGEIKGDVRLLKALSAHLKGEIDAHILLIAFDAIQRNRDIQSVIPFWDYVDEVYEKAGIKALHERITAWEREDGKYITL